MNSIKCPYCRKENKNTNIRCEFCNTQLIDTSEYKNIAKANSTINEKLMVNIVFLITAGPGLIIGLTNIAKVVFHIFSSSNEEIDILELIFGLFFTIISTILIIVGWSLNKYISEDNIIESSQEPK